MIKKIHLFWVAACLTACGTTVTNPLTPISEHNNAGEAEISINDAKLAAENHKDKPNTEAAALSESMMIPAEAKKTKSGYAYVQLKAGTAEKPAHTDAVKVFLRVLNIEGTLIDEGETTLAVSHSTPFLEEMISVMNVGEQIRVWGESQARIWEIELLSIDTSFRAPEDVAAPPENAQVLNGFEDVHWRIIEPGQGDKIKPGEAYRIHATRWNAQGDILESSKDGRGMLLIFNDEYAAQDPVHHAVLKQMRPGMRVRLWIPATRLGTDYHLVEDFWIVERLMQLEPPKDMMPPKSDAEVVTIEPDKAWLRLEVPGDGIKLTENSSVKVDMTCWNAQTAKLIDATYLRERPDIMDIRPELGIWQKIMMQASVGSTMTVWILKSALPENVGMDMTCRVKVLEHAATKDFSK